MKKPVFLFVFAISLFMSSQAQDQTSNLNGNEGQGDKSFNDSTDSASSKDKFFRYGHNNFVALNPGVGNSYGGLGVKIQTRFGGVVGFGFHAGIGLDPANMDVIPAGGIKFYPYKWIYINALIGYEIINSYLAYSALLAGVDMTFGKRFGFNAGLGVANYEGWIGPALDGGLIIRIIK